MHCPDPIAVVEDPVSGSSYSRSRLLVGFRQQLLEGNARCEVVAPAVPGWLGRIPVPPVLLDVLAVIARGTGEPERPLLQYRSRPFHNVSANTTVARCRRTPQARPRPKNVTVGARARVIMRQIAPCVAAAL